MVFKSLMLVQWSNVCISLKLLMDLLFVPIFTRELLFLTHNFCKMVYASVQPLYQLHHRYTLSFPCFTVMYHRQFISTAGIRHTLCDIFRVARETYPDETKLCSITFNIRNANARIPTLSLQPCGIPMNAGPAIIPSWLRP